MRTILNVCLVVLAAALGPAASAQDARLKIMPKQAITSPSFVLFQGDGRNFLLSNPLEYEIRRTGKIIVVPGGFVTDFASVPRWAQWIISILGKHSVPAIAHDYLYWEQKCSREQADLIFLDAMQEYQSSWFSRTIVYYAVRIGAGGNWTTNAEDRKKGLVKVVPSSHGTIPPNTDWREYRKKLFDEGVREEPLDGDGSYCSLEKA